jgi:hypothetical protein
MRSLFSKLFSKAGDPGGKEPAMGEQNATATPPAVTGGISKEEVKAIVAEQVQSLTQSVSEVSKTLGEVTKNQKVLADTLAAVKVPSGEEIAQIAAEKAQAAIAAQRQTSEQAAARQATIDKLVAEKLGGKAELGKLLSAASEAELTAQAEAIATALPKPDVPPASENGGATPNAQPGPVISPLSGLSAGVAGYAASIKLPGK